MGADRGSPQLVLLMAGIACWREGPKATPGNWAGKVSWPVGGGEAARKWRGAGADGRRRPKGGRGGSPEKQNPTRSLLLIFHIFLLYYFLFPESVPSLSIRFKTKPAQKGPRPGLEGSPACIPTRSPLPSSICSRRTPPPRPTETARTATHLRGHRLPADREWICAR